MPTGIFYRSLLFGARSGNKCVNEDDSIRGLISAGQGARACSEGAKGTSIFARALGKTATAFNNMAKNDKLMNGIGKTVKFASDNVNPLIVLSSGIKVLKADDRQTEIITQGGCLAGMFAMEGWMAKHLDPLIDKLPINKKFAPIVKGVSFVIGSLSASTLGEFIGKNIAKCVTYNPSPAQ